MRLPVRSGRVVALALGLCAFAWSLLGSHSDPGYADDRLRLSGNHPLQAEVFAPLGNAALDAPLEMQIRFAVRHQAALDQLLEDQQKPASARYHQWLKTGEFFSRFGPSSSEVEALEHWLMSEGFAIASRAPGYLEFKGTVAQAQQAFDVRIARFGDGSVYANTSDPVVPRPLANVIGAILGMDNMTHAVPVTHQLPHAKGNQNKSPEPDARTVQLAQAEIDSSESSDPTPIGGVIIGSSEAFGPADMRTFYNEAVGVGQDGSGQCIAIVGVSDFRNSTMTTFANQFDLPAISFTRKLHGADPGFNSAEAEAELDLQWSHAAAPGASIDYHYGSNLVTDISAAVTDNACGAISISYAFCGPTASFINNTLHPIFVQAAAQGQSVFVSSGDQGAAGLASSNGSCVVGTSRLVNEMSADPNVTAVGGTQFTPVYSGGNDVGHTAENVWNDGIGATGGGASQFFAKPSYQTGLGLPNDGARDVPDIALMASPILPGVFIADDQNGTAKITCCIGGTSLSAPIWAGFSRVIAQLSGITRLGNLNPLIYNLAGTQYATAGFRDVTNGNNNYNGVAGFSAGPGYDQSTGWGTVDFNTFANAAKNYLTHTSPTATSTPTATTTGGMTPTSSASATPTPTPAPEPNGGTLSVPKSVRFPAVGVGMPAAPLTFMVTNRSLSSTLTVDIGTLAAPFKVVGGGHYTLPPATRVSVTIELATDTVGTPSQGLSISSGDPKHPQVNVAVSATVQAGKLAVPHHVSLAAKPGSSVAKTMILKNSGKGMLSGTVQPFAAGSTLTLDDGPIAFELAPGETRPITIHFAPPSAGSVSANLAIDTTPPPGTTMIVVTGSAR